MPDTKTLATFVIFIVCALYILALFLIGLKFLFQYLRFHNEGDNLWSQSTGETPRNSFRHNLRINRMEGCRHGQGRRAVEPPPSYSYAIDEPPPSYEDYEKNYKDDFKRSSAQNLNDTTCPKSQNKPKETIVNIELTDANNNACSSMPVQCHNQYLVHM